MNDKLICPSLFSNVGSKLFKQTSFFAFLKIIYWYTHNKFNENYASLGATVFTLYKLVSINSFSYIKHFKYLRGNIDLRCSISFKPLTKVFLLSTCIWCCNTEGQFIAKPWTGTAHNGCFDSPINHDTEDYHDYKLLRKGHHVTESIHMNKRF